MKKLLLSFTAITAIGAGSALAADMPVKAVYKAPPVYAYSWTGCYVGGNGGGLWLRKDYSVGAPALGGFATVAPAVGTNLGTHDASSWVGGVQVGCNYQFAGNWVIGIQGDYDWTDATGTHADLVTAVITDRSRARSLASVTGRVGYAWDRFLGYVKGGGAWERDNYDTFVTATSFPLATASETRSGWTVGIGGEYAFNNWLTAFVEYDYYNMGTRTIGFTSPTTGLAFRNDDLRERKSVVKVGLNFKFGDWSPVVARY
jgi:outer membrane immunogenic protein